MSFPQHRHYLLSSSSVLGPTHVDKADKCLSTGILEPGAIEQRESLEDVMLRRHTTKLQQHEFASAAAMAAEGDKNGGYNHKATTG